MIGAGRAGRARLRALEESERATLASIVRRGEGPSLDRVLADPTVDAVIVCTPNALHEAQVRAALDARKHVVVEFPLAATRASGAALFELARRRGRVLHVEHIELLSSTQEAQRERAAGLGRPTGGLLEFRGAAGGWIGDDALAGSAALRAIARLHRLVDLFGPARVERARLAAMANGYALEVGLQFEQGGQTVLREQRGPDLPRRTRWRIECERGLLDDPPEMPAGALFARDLEHFVDRVRGECDPYVPEERVLHVLGLVDEIEEVEG